jgi:hypothetical protein
MFDVFSKKLDVFSGKTSNRQKPLFSLHLLCDLRHRGMLYRLRFQPLSLHLIVMKIAYILLKIAYILPVLSFVAFSVFGFSLHLIGMKIAYISENL